MFDELSRKLDTALSRMRQRGVIRIGFTVLGSPRW